jgi:hypothetical protein
LTRANQFLGQSSKKLREDLLLQETSRDSKETFQRPRGEGAIWYHLEGEKTPEMKIGSEREDHQRSRRSPVRKLSRARGWWVRGEPSLRDLPHVFFLVVTLYCIDMDPIIIF